MSTKQQELTREARLPQLDRALATQLAATEYARVADLLDQLTPEQWAAQTDCPEWDVRAMAGHMLGMVQMAASVPEMIRQQATAALRARRRGGLQIDALTALQVEKNAALTAEEVARQYRRLSPQALRNRRRSPTFLRNQTMEEETDGRWTFGYLFDVILTRDPFMHRIDITRATGMEMLATADHEGVIVDDAVHEWALRHGRPVVLELSGPAGGHWTFGDGGNAGGGGEHFAMDPFEFCRVTSGRAPAAGLLATQVPF
ncbi:maleylpyruvate isomerase family mycothiol-dependent enzyme [Nesterenkonia sp. LB17]|uniref:maleylpyruvate isomerase family mycothiol-dependent enzyme n=1 Tax=Nesterenkonia sp. LB17 TaxID=2901230 RepID=UPI001F4C6E06|nr:maleylpyruvate isomerase family mycothiol-dependent enzyme [Nesterenkonia sp. LB17]MCH8564933.1 maleylpyruvate isomerase family mycothiol-dependent enzyme [Nesterenkonia sp. LB17]